MFRPSDAREAKVKRSASVPNAGIPSGNSFLVFLPILSACLGFIKPVVRLATKSSILMPSIKSIGSKVFPLDLLIFWPSASRTKPWTYTVLNGTLPVKWQVIITIRATQKKMMSKPVTNTDEGRKCLIAGVSSGQPSELKGTSAELNQVSSTSGSRLS